MLNAPANPWPFQPGPRPGTGLLLDATFAPILNSRFDLESVLNFGVGVATTGGTVAQNKIEIDHLHTNAVNSTLWRMHEGFSQNWVRVGGLSVDEGASGVAGLVVDGTFNDIHAAPGDQKGFTPSEMFVLAPSAQHNTLSLMTSGELARGMVTDRSVVGKTNRSTNRIRWMGA